MRRIVVSIFIIYLFASLSTNQVYGQKFKLKTKAVSVGSESESSLSPLSNRLDSKQEGQFHINGFVFLTGYSYLKALQPMKIEVDDTHIELGKLTNGKISKSAFNISIIAPASFAIKVNQNGPLSSIEGSTIIPDTSCNGGRQKCTESIGRAWTKHNEAGFGYRFDSNFATNDFKSESNFRRFPDKKAHENSAIVMQGGTPIENVSNNIRLYTGKLTAKAVAFEQKNESVYSTIIDLIAIPSY